MVAQKLRFSCCRWVVSVVLLLSHHCNRIHVNGHALEGQTQLKVLVRAAQGVGVCGATGLAVQVVWVIGRLRIGSLTAIIDSVPAVPVIAPFRVY